MAKVQNHLSELIVIRDEILEEKTEVHKKDKDGKVVETLNREVGTGISAIYNIHVHTVSDDLLFKTTTSKIANCIKAYVMMFGEEGLDEEKISAFVKKNAGVDVEVNFDKVTKQYCFPAPTNNPHYSQEFEINLNKEKTLGV